MSSRDFDESRRLFRERLELHRRRHEITLDVERTDYVTWDALPVRIFFFREPTSENLSELEEFAVGWQRVGVAGGFEGMVHNAKVKELRSEGSQPMLEIVLDLGSAPELALDVFLRGLRGLKTFGIPIDHVVLGWNEGE